MESLVKRQRQRLAGVRRELGEWQRAALGLLALSAGVNAASFGLLGLEHGRALDLQEEVRQAESVRDMAVRELGAVSLASAKAEQARAEQAAAYEAIGAWEYVGECLSEPCSNRDAYWLLCYTGPFMSIWDKTIKPAGRVHYSWKANPWVWVIEFERITKEEAMKSESEIPLPPMRRS